MSSSNRTSYKSDNVSRALTFHRTTSNKVERTSSMDRVGKLLKDNVPPENLSIRRGAGNKKFTYIESWRVLDTANEIFGYNGWSCSIVSTSVQRRKEGHKFVVTVTAVVRVSLENGSYHEDLGVAEHKSSREVDAEQRALKSAVSDARKRALRLFGRALGNCVYDKAYVSASRTRPNPSTQPNTQSKGEVDLFDDEDDSMYLNLDLNPPKKRQRVAPPPPQYSRGTTTRSGESGRGEAKKV